MPDGREAYFNTYDILGGVDINALSPGEEVSFEVLHTHRGLEAFNIQTFAYA